MSLVIKTHVPGHVDQECGEQFAPLQCAVCPREALGDKHRWRSSGMPLLEPLCVHMCVVNVCLYVYYLYVHCVQTCLYGYTHTHTHTHTHTDVPVYVKAQRSEVGTGC